MLRWLLVHESFWESKTIGSRWPWIASHASTFHRLLSIISLHRDLSLHGAAGREFHGRIDRVNCERLSSPFFFLIHRSGLAKSRVHLYLRACVPARVSKERSERYSSIRERAALLTWPGAFSPWLMKYRVKRETRYTPRTSRAVWNMSGEARAGNPPMSGPRWIFACDEFATG
jgi:hypothetical protein